MPSYGTIPELPHVAQVFCPSECVRLIQDQASMRNVYSRINSLRFDCCVFLLYSFSAVTFATKSANNRHSHCSRFLIRSPHRRWRARLAGWRGPAPWQISPALVDRITPPEQTTCGQPHEVRKLVLAGLGGAA